MLPWRRKKLGLKVKTLLSKTVARLTHYDGVLRQPSVRHTARERERVSESARCATEQQSRVHDRSRSNHLLIVVVHFAAIKCVRLLVCTNV